MLPRRLNGFPLCPPPRASSYIQLVTVRDKCKYKGSARHLFFHSDRLPRYFYSVFRFMQLKRCRIKYKHSQMGVTLVSLLQLSPKQHLMSVKGSCMVNILHTPAPMLLTTGKLTAVAAAMRSCLGVKLSIASSTQSKGALSN